MCYIREIERRKLNAECAARLSIIGRHDKVLVRIFKNPEELINWPEKLPLLLEKSERNEQFNAKICGIFAIFSIITWSLSMANIIYETSFDYALEQPRARNNADRDFNVGNTTYCRQIYCAAGASIFNVTSFGMAMQCLFIFPVFALVLLFFSLVHYPGKGFSWRDVVMENLLRLDIIPYHLCNVISALMLVSLDIAGLVALSRDCVPAITVQSGYDWAYHQQFSSLCALNSSLPQCFLGKDAIVIMQEPEIGLLATAMAASSKTAHLALLALFAFLMFLSSGLLKRLSPLEFLFVSERIYNRSPYSEIRDAFLQPDLKAALTIFKPRDAPVLNITELNIGGVINDADLKMAVIREFVSTHAYVRRRSALLAWSYGIPPESIIPVQEAAGVGAASGVARYSGVAAAEAQQPLLG
jgi:hypothetical protein